LEDPVDRVFVREAQAGTLAKAIPQDFFEVLVAEAMKVPARVWREAFEHLLNEDLVAELSKIEVPSLVVWGDRDGVVSRADQNSLVAEIKGSLLVVYAGAGHSPHWEEPERFASDLSAFIRSRETPQSPGRKSM
jgi:non-heme chloroperoxidase